MHPQVLSDSQKQLLSLVQVFSGRFYLAGGTAIALQMGHRRSIDFDLFTKEEIHPEKLINDITRQNHSVDHIFFQSADELTLAVQSVKLSFVSYPFAIPHETWLESIISMPDLLSLAAMKAYALGRRAKWKDYVDLYMLFMNYASLDMVTDRAREIFQGAFNERLFREQLCYFEDIDYTEDIDYLIEKPTDSQEVQVFLIDLATQDVRR